MLSKLGYLSLFVALSIQAQSKPGGGIIDPDDGIPEEESQTISRVDYILAAVKKNMGMCGSVEKQLSSMKDLHQYLSDIQNKRAVEVITGASDVAQTDNPQCAKPTFTIISSEVSCLLMGVEESMHSFASKKASAKYLQKSLGMSKSEASGMLHFMRLVNETGLAKIKEIKKKKMKNTENEKWNI